MLSFPDFIGIIGVLAILLAYFMSQRGALNVTDKHYLWMNFFGSLAIVFSLFWSWNLSAFIINGAWAAISGYGILKVWHKE
ncbi:MAG TPA: hypothetical protein VFT64_00855 [Rickettsiales bacterium]|nr:hypothetical protein [Rickettsiales bacterium]